MGVSGAIAGPNGTTSLQDVINAKSVSGGTIAANSGEVSVQWTNTTGSDTTYTDTNTTVATTVDTGFDMIPGMNSNYPTEGNQTVTPGDSVVYTIQVKNEGNNAKAVPFTLNLKTDSGVDGEFTQELYQDSNDNNTFDTGTDAEVTSSAVGSDSDILFMEDSAETFFAVVTAKNSASNGDTLGNDFFVTDNAPIGNGTGGTAGDQWEDTDAIGGGVPITGEDANDTQDVFFRTEVQGPVLSVSKSFSLVSGSARPGDTVEYSITVENTGADTASNEAVVDAMPDSTTFVPGSATDDADVTPSYSTTLQESDDFGSAGGTGSTDTERVKFALDGIDLGPGDTKPVTFKVTID